MARSVRLASLINQVRQRADREGSNFVTDQEIIEFISGSWAVVYEILIATNENYALSSHDYTVVSGQDAYDLPDDFYKERGVDITINGCSWPADRFEFADRNLYAYAGVWTDGSPVAFDIWGDQLKIIPTPQGSASIKLYYYPAPARLSDANDTIDGIAGYEEAVILDAALKCRQKERDEAPFLKALRDEQFQRIRSFASSRSKGSPPRVSRSRYHQTQTNHWRKRLV